MLLVITFFHLLQLAENILIKYNSIVNVLFPNVYCDIHSEISP